MQYVNLGCGGVYHRDWINIDFVKTGPEVITHNLLKGVPLPNKSCDVVYHAHFLEHLRKPEALFFMRECYRVLKPGGILRVVVPDLEQICRLYLQKLQDALDGNANAAYDYEWMKLEMYDQAVREYQSGGTGDYLKQDPLPSEDFVFQRAGAYGREIIIGLRAQKSQPKPLHVLLPRSSRFVDRVINWCLKHILDEDDRVALSIGRFRQTGEVHQWMYDRFSLAQLMLSAGFVNPIVQSARNSQIENWVNFNLDTSPDGSVNKPESFYMEAVVPN